MTWLDARRWALLGVVLLAGAFYTWTALTSAGVTWGGDLRDPLNLQTDAFLHGHTYLPLPVDPALPHTDKPVVNGGTDETHDLSLYNGKLYSYWGPVPVLAVFLPFRALGAGDLPPAAAALIFALVGLVALALLVDLLARRLLPATPTWMPPAAVAGIAFANLFPYLLRRPTAYEVALLAGISLVVLGLLALAAALSTARPRVVWLAVASLCFGLAIGARPPLGLAVIFLAVAAVAVLRGPLRGDARERRRALVALAAPWAVCVVALAIYNQVRFGSPTEFGVAYQLSGYDQTRTLKLEYVLPGLWHYLIAPPLPRVQFPYWWLNPVTSGPFHASYYVGYERTSGVLTTAPFVLMLLVAPWALRRTPIALRTWVATLVGVGLLLLVFVAWFFWGTIMRYETEFATLLLLGAALTWFALALRARTRARRGIWLRRTVAIAGSALLLYGALAGIAISLVGEDDQFRHQHAGTFDSLTRFFAPLPTLATTIVGHPVPAAIDGDAAVSPQRYSQLGVQDYTYEIGATPRQLQVVSPGRRSVVLRTRLVRGPAIPDDQRLVLQAHSADGFTGEARVDGRVKRIPVRLNRGLNTVTLTLQTDRPLPDVQPSKLGEIRAEYIQLEPR